MAKNVMSALAGTKTEQNLMNAAKDEALAYTKYILFSEMADREGQPQVSNTLREIAQNEKEHASLWLGYLGEMGDTLENIEDSIDREDFDEKTFYPEASRIAKDEGFGEIADKFRKAGNAEHVHSRDCKKLLSDMTEGTMYSGSADTEWKCLNCGCESRGNTPPDFCPLCSYPKSFYVREGCKNA